MIRRARDWYSNEETEAAGKKVSEQAEDRFGSVTALGNRCTRSLLLLSCSCFTVLGVVLLHCAPGSAGAEAHTAVTL